MGGPDPTTDILADQRGRWRRGDRVRVERLLDEKPAIKEQTEVLLDLIYAEVLLRREVGERPGVAEYVDRFPTLADPLRAQFEVDAALDGEPTQIGDSSPSSSAVPTYPAPPGYVILGELGRGGMGVVYKARHLELDRLVALKMIRAGELADPAERMRFAAEARAAARLSHPNIVQVHEVGSVGGRPFLAMEYVGGGTLGDTVRDRPLPAKLAADVVATLARAVHHAHAQGVIHRDLKPANVLLSGPDPGATTADQQFTSGSYRIPISTFRVPKIADFGLAKRLGADDMTHTGEFLGTPNYAAPEQAAGRPDVGPPADVYSLGAVLYDLVTGRPPFAGSTPLETLDQVRFADPVSPSRLRPNLPRDLETICLHCLHKDPAKRYPTADALAEDLERFLSRRPIAARPVGPIERAVKWCRRRPSVAALLTALALLFATALVTSTVLWQRAASARDDEGAARRDERAQRERAEARSAELLIANARYAWQTDDLDLARTTLAECPPEYRSATWVELNRACSASRLVIPPRPFSITNIAYSRDGQQLVGGAANGKVFVWNADTGREERVIEVPGQAIDSLGFLADGRVAAVGRVTLRDAKRERQDFYRVSFLHPGTGRLESGWDRADKPFRFVQSPDGRHAVIVPPMAKTADLVNIQTGQVLHKLTSRIGNVTQASFSPDGRFLAIYALPLELVVWGVATGAEIRRFPCPSDCFGGQGLAIRGDGQRVTVGRSSTGPASEVVVLDAAVREVNRWATRLPGFGQTAYNPDGSRLVAGTYSSTVIQVWDADTGREQIVLRGHPAAVQCFAIHPDGRHLAAGYKDGRVVVWDMAPE